MSTSAIPAKALTSGSLITVFLILVAVVSLSTASFLLLYMFNVFDLEKMKQLTESLNITWSSLEAVQKVLPFLLAFVTIFALVYRHFFMEADVFVPNTKHMPEIVPLFFMLATVISIVFMDIYGLIAPLVPLLEQMVRNFYEPLYKAITSFFPPELPSSILEIVAAYFWLSVISGHILTLIDKGAKKFATAGLVAFFATPVIVLPGMVLFTDAIEKSFEVVEKIGAALGVPSIVLPYAALLLLSIYKTIRKILLPGGGADLVHVLAGPLLLSMFTVAKKLQAGLAAASYTYIGTAVLDTCVMFMYLLYIVNCVVLWSLAIAMDKKSFFTRSCAVISSIFFTPLVVS